MIYVVIIGLALVCWVARTVDRPGYWRRLLAATTLMIGVAHVCACGGIVDLSSTWATPGADAGDAATDAPDAQYTAPEHAPDASYLAPRALPGAPASVPGDEPPGASPHSVPCRWRCGGGGQ